VLAINSEGNMPYDLCEDIPSLDVIETEMTKRGKQTVALLCCNFSFQFFRCLSGWFLTCDDMLVQYVLWCSVNLCVCPSITKSVIPNG